MMCKKIINTGIEGNKNKVGKIKSNLQLNSTKFDVNTGIKGDRNEVGNLTSDMTITTESEDEPVLKKSINLTKFFLIPLAVAVVAGLIIHVLTRWL